MAQCYDWNSETQLVGTLPTDTWLQCPSGNTCCVGGSVCLDHNLCHVPGSSTSSDGSYSSYYVARCSDPTYTSPDCQKVCDAPGPPDAVYNYTSQQWNCCGKDASGNVSCNNPTTEIFQAPAPADLKELSTGVAIESTATLAAGGKTSTSTSVSTSSSLISSSPISDTQTSTTISTGSTTASSQPQQTETSLSTSSSSSTTGLSTGAKAGIGIGVALAVLAIAALVFFLLRRRKQSVATAKNDANSNLPGYSDYPSDNKDANAAVPVMAEKSVHGDGDVYLPRSELSSSTHELVSGTGSGSGSVEMGGRGVHEIGSSR